MNYLRRAWAEIDIDALVHNFNTIKGLTSAKIFSVVKANAYGHAVPLVAKALEAAGTDYFAVSNINEACELRELGISVPILILGYTPATLADRLAANDIIQTVYSLDYAEKLSRNAKKLGVTVEAHLKLDTGMGRIGFDCRNFFAGFNDAKAALSLEGLNFTGIFTHFPSADSEATLDVAYTREQFERFSSAIKMLEESGFTFNIKHCCNSAATLLQPDMHLDAIRPGIILYGLTPDPGLTLPVDLKYVMTFKSVVSLVKTLNASETVSYGRTYTAEAPVKIATVSAGYADGLPRLLSSTGEVLIKGKRAPIVGRICMDQFCCDVSHIDGVEEGDTVTLFGKELPVEEMAEKARTINYEIVCGISKRVPRICIKDGKELDI